jgi:hypothetical protein
MNTNRFESPPKHAKAKNPVILGVRSAFWIFWIPATVAVFLLVAALYWLLTHSLPVSPPAA